ncbi:PDZ domain-containing protein [Chitinophaga cymbidii]|uniref:PDZ domain-containing protein n=1 Tax=Chitinophaga cymbidii TaxID=1096750 RepID=A0A512RI61_9BACT|nr:PDZ domain-containing protein [Chitinophaga cymbidii]GEP95371.1 hypothetical protein CCY01nite_16310 [Chitinophaga cymbidii]
MRRFLYTLGFTAITALALPAAAQDNRSDKMGEYDEIVIKRKDGNKNAKVTVEIKDGEVLVDGKKIEDYKNGSVIVQHRVITPRNGNAPESGEMLFPGMGDNAWSSITPNPAVLGVITEKQEAVGATITTVSEGSAAEKAGLKAGDVISRVNDKAINEPQELYEAIGELKPGDKVTVTYKRNGKENKATATLQKRENTQPRSFRIMPDGQDNNFFRFRTPDQRGRSPFGDFFRGNSGTRLGLSVQDTQDNTGAKVLGVTSGSAAAKAGFKENDIITEIGGQTVKNAKDVVESYRDNKDKGAITAKVKRNGNVQTLNITVPKQLNTENL